MFAHALSCINQDPGCVNGYSDIKLTQLIFEIGFFLIPLICIGIVSYFLLRRRTASYWFVLSSVSVLAILSYSLLVPRAFDRAGMIYCPEFCKQGQNYELQVTLYNLLYKAVGLLEVVAVASLLVGLFIVAKNIKKTHETRDDTIT